MTEINKTSRKFASIFYGDDGAYPSNLWIKVARWHLSEIKKAELRARIDERTKYRFTVGNNLEKERIFELQSELRKLEEV